MKKVLLLVLLLSFGFVQPLTAATFTNEYPFYVVKQIEIDRSIQDPKEIIHHVIEVLRENVEQSSWGYFQVISSNDGMEPLPVNVIHCPPNWVNGQLESASQIELISDKDRQFIRDLGGQYGVTLPWNISVFSTSDMLAQMISTMPNSEFEMPVKNYIMVTIGNPMLTSKVAYRDLDWRTNMAINQHLKDTRTLLKNNVERILTNRTNYNWKNNNNPMYNGMLKVTKKDVDAFPAEKLLPELLVSDGKDDVAAAYTNYVRKMYGWCTTPGTQLNGISKMTAAFFDAMFSWEDPNQPFDLDMSGMGGPAIHFDNLEDAKTKIPTLLDNMYGPLWAGNMVSQPWQYMRRFSVDFDGDVDVVEMYSAYFAGIMTASGFHHAPALPCMVGFRVGDMVDVCDSCECDEPDNSWPEDNSIRGRQIQGAFINMYAAEGTLRFAFKDVTMMMQMMDMPVQLYMFQIFPDYIYNELAALANGAIQQTGRPERFELVKFSDKF